MKRVILSSFGYHDDWIDPPDPDYEAEEFEAAVEYNNIIIQYDDGEIILPPDFEYHDICDEDYQTYTRIVEEQSVQELSEEVLDDEIIKKYGDIKTIEKFKLNGSVYFPYTLWIPTKRNKYGPLVYDDGYPIELEYDIDYNKIYWSGSIEMLK